MTADMLIITVTLITCRWRRRWWRLCDHAMW